MSFKTAFEEAGRRAWEKIVNDMPAGERHWYETAKALSEELDRLNLARPPSEHSDLPSVDIHGADDVGFTVEVVRGGEVIASAEAPTLTKAEEAAERLIGEPNRLGVVELSPARVGLSPATIADLYRWERALSTDDPALLTAAEDHQEGWTLADVVFASTQAIEAAKALGCPVTELARKVCELRVDQLAQEVAPAAGSVERSAPSQLYSLRKSDRLAPQIGSLIASTLDNLLVGKGINIDRCAVQELGCELRYDVARGLNNVGFSLYPSGKARLGGKESGLHSDCLSILQALGYEVRS